MRIVESYGNEQVARVYLAKDEKGRMLEFVESVQPPIPREEKWVLIISTLYGCPVKCRFCDAGGDYSGKVSHDELLFQIDAPILKRFPDRKIPVKKFKIQFARMGEPAFNMDVLKVLDNFKTLYDAPGFMPSISTIAPMGTDDFFEKLLEIKNRLYLGRFQLQFSLHSTSEQQREVLMPVKKWGLEKIAQYGERFYQNGDRKITLNFALDKNSELDPTVLKKYFDPAVFLIKITPLNPTYKVKTNNMESFFDISANHSQSMNKERPLLKEIRNAGFDCILSIGELEENQIGSNCGQYVMSHKKSKEKMPDGYTYIHNSSTSI